MVAVLLLLLGLLATLQYRWIGRLSEIEEERMRASIELSTRRFAADFNAEVTRAFLHFQRVGFRGGSADGSLFGLRPVGDDGGEGGPSEQAVRLFDSWRDEARFPELFGEIVWLPEGVGSPALRLAAGAEAFAPTDECYEFERPFGRRAGRGGPELPFSAEVDGLVIALFDRPPGGGGPLGRRGRSPWELGEPTAFWILRFDRQTLVEGVLPALGRAHFGWIDGASFDFAVLAADATAPVFVSRPGLSPADWTPDSVQPLMRMLSPEEGRSLWRGALPGRAGGSFERRRGGGAPVGRGPIEPGTLAARRAEAAAAPSAFDGSPWRLVVRHSEGSLSAAVARLRQRNLAIGSGVLLLLAAAVGALFVASRRAAELARQQVEFVAGISHELRTPLAAVRSLGENLADGIVRSDEQMRRYGAQITRQTGRLTELVDQVLQFAGGLSDRPPPTRSPLALGRLIERAVGDCASLAEDRGAEIEVELSDRAPSVLGDAEGLRSALRNLLSNAIKYGGEAPRVRIEAAAADGWVEVSVVDGGGGIAANELGRIFEPFYRADEARDAQVEGTGLGLSLVKEIVESHGGRVDVESRPGVGSRFTVGLPALPAGGEGPDGGRSDGGGAA